MYGNGLKMCQERLRLATRNSFYVARVVRGCNSLPREVLESPSLDVLHNHVAMAPGAKV